MFLFHLKSSFHCQDIKFLSWLFGHLISKSMTPQPGWQAMAIHIFPNKDNQPMKFGQLIQYNMRNISVEKSYTKYAGETIPRSLSKKIKLSISLDQ